MRGQAESFSLAVPTEPGQQDGKMSRMAREAIESFDACLRPRTAEKQSTPISMRPQSTGLRPKWISSLSAWAFGRCSEKHSDS